MEKYVQTIKELRLKIMDLQINEDYSTLDSLFVELISTVERLATIDSNYIKVDKELLDTFDQVQFDILHPYPRVTPAILSSRMKKIVRKMNLDLKPVLEEQS